MHSYGNAKPTKSTIDPGLPWYFKSEDKNDKGKSSIYQERCNGDQKHLAKGVYFVVNDITWRVSQPEIAHFLHRHRKSVAEELVGPFVQNNARKGEH